MPTVSIIVPVYKVELFLKECVESILNQSFNDFELLLVDDGSPDKCPELCDYYSIFDKRVISIHKQNGGLSSARNFGLEVAKGKYIMFVDSDDFIEKNTVEYCVRLIEQTGSDAIKFEFKKNGSTFNKRENRPSGIDFKLFCFHNTNEKIHFLENELLEYKIKWEAWSWFIKKSLIDSKSLRLPDNKLIFAEDVYYSIAIVMLSNKITYTNATLYNYRVREDSIMRTTNDSKINELNNLSYYIYSLFRNDFCPDNFYKIHFAIVSNRFYLMPFLNSFSSYATWKKTINSISNKQFFKMNNNKYYKFYKTYMRQKKNFFSTEIIRNRYLATFNGFFCILEIIAYKIVNIFRSKKNAE